MKNSEVKIKYATIIFHHNKRRKIELNSIVNTADLNRIRKNLKEKYDALQCYLVYDEKPVQNGLFQ